MRARASLQHYLATVAGDVVYLHQFSGSAIAAQLPAGAVDLEIQTGYPWSGRVEITVRSAPEAEVGLAVRVPAWAPGAALTVGGQPADATAQGGYQVVRRRWQPGDVLVLDLDLSPRLSYPSRHIDALRGTAAVERGPLVYCFEQADHGQVSIEDLAVSGSALGEQPAAPELGESVAVSVPAVHQPPAPPEAYPGQLDVPADSQPAMAVAIPYFQWDNRDGGPMRVWLPLHDPSERGAAPEADTEPDRVPRARQIP
jgi:hypothetical protein